MNKEVITDLENYIFEHKNNPYVAAGMMADYLGVMIGVKPSATNHFDATELINIDLIEFNELLGRAGLKAIFFKQDWIDMGKLTWLEDIYVSHDIKTALKLRQAFTKLYSSMDDIGQILDQESWEESSRGIGHLLGYPETAIDYFITEQNIDDEERKQLMRRYHFYVHSPKHHEQEYQSYDYKILQAIRDYAPKTASELLSDNQQNYSSIGNNA